MNNEINLTEEICRRFKNIGFDIQISEEKMYVIKYLLTTSIINIFGKNEFDANEIDLLSSNGKIEIKTIFDEKAYFVEAEDKNNIVCKNENQYVPFMIQVTESGISAEIDKQNGESINRSCYDVNLKTNTCTLRKELQTGEDFEVEYEGSLTSIGAKFKETEYFSYSKNVPTTNNEKKSLLKRIYDGIKNDDIVTIRTCLDICELPYICDTIFGVLEEKYAQAVQERNGSNIKKK